MTAIRIEDLPVAAPPPLPAPGDMCDVLLPLGPHLELMRVTCVVGDDGASLIPINPKPRTFGAGVKVEGVDLMTPMTFRPLEDAPITFVYDDGEPREFRAQPGRILPGSVSEGGFLMDELGEWQGKLGETAIVRIDDLKAARMLAIEEAGWLLVEQEWRESDGDLGLYATFFRKERPA